MADRAELQRLRALDAGTGSRAELERLRALETPVAEPQTPEYSAKDALAPWDAMLHFGTGMASAPVAGLTGLASLAIPGVDSGNVVRGIQEKLTYQPRTILGGELAETVGEVLSIPAKVADYAGENVAETDLPFIGKSPAAGAAVNTAIQTIPMLLGSRGAAAVRDNAITRAGNNSVKNATMRDASDAGYVLPPSEMAQSPAGKAVAGLAESIAGRKALGEDISARNTERVTEGARQDATVPGRGQISEADLDAARAPHIAVYEEVRNLSPAAADVVQMWREANAAEKAQRNFYRRSMNPEAQQAAEAAGRRADFLSQFIEHEARSHGRPELAQALRRARVELGRIGTVERATNEATGNVSANSLRKAQDRGAPLTGNMERAADVSRAFRDQFTKSDVVQPGVSGSNAVAQLLAAFGGPKNLLLLGMPWAMRRALLSRPAQIAARPSETVLPISTLEQLMRAGAIGGMQNQPQTERDDDVGALLQLQ